MRKYSSYFNRVGICILLVPKQDDRLVEKIVFISIHALLLPMMTLSTDNILIVY